MKIRNITSQIDLPVRDGEAPRVADIEVVWVAAGWRLVCATRISISLGCAWLIDAEIMTSPKAWTIAGILVSGDWVILVTRVNRHLFLGVVSVLQDPHKATTACLVAIKAAPQPADARVCTKDITFRGLDDNYKGAFASAVVPENIRWFTMFGHSVAKSLHWFAWWQLAVDPGHIIAVSDNPAADAA